jgi:hypothetical protein
MTGDNVRSISICAVAATLCACGPVVEHSSDLPSPDSHLTATLERVDNGLGFGQGAAYDEVHVSHPHAWRFLWRHGDPDKSVVFYAEESGDSAQERPVVHWADAHHLVIEYLVENKPGRQLTRFEDITITYQTFAKPDTK